MKQNNAPDEFHGVGGSFVIDPDTGLRRRADEAQQDAPAAPLPGDVPADVAAAAQSTKTTRSK